ncbi:MAG: pseudouridine synthase [Clostridiaceae bacterium]|nr:pseudouridine synthase [Clostridiaceae bacterium]
MRINHYIARSGVCSRRRADELIAQGRVLINEVPASLGQKVAPTDVVLVDNKRISPVPADEHVVLALNKPAGITCTSNPRRRDNIITFVNYPKRVFTIGRLDRDSRGLILLTDDGDLAYRLTRTEYGHEKEYFVSVDKLISDSFIKTMSAGVHILDTVTLPCRVWQTGEREFHIVLTQGLNRQIRRMCEALGYQVKDLMRTRILHIVLGNLPEGKLRELTGKERTELDKLVMK